MLAKYSADQLDPEPVSMGIDERNYLQDSPSSSAPKKADAAFKISFGIT